MLCVPVMVSIDARQVHDLLLPGISPRCFRGVSLAELLDDVALHLMETIPKMPPARMAEFQLCPNIELRRVKVEADFQGPNKKKIPWSGRLAVVLTRWREDNFYEAVVPRLGTERFAVEQTSYLEAALARYVEAWAQERDLTDLEPYVCQTYEYLEILEVDTELPSVLPSRVPKQAKKKKKGKKDKPGDPKPKEEKPKEKPKRQVVSPHALRQVGVNLTHKAIDGRLRAAFGRGAVVDQLLRLVQRPGAAVLLVGPSGVGKTAIVHEVVRRLAEQRAGVQDRTDVWEVNGNRIIAGMSMVGAWEQRCKQMIEELHLRQDILYVEDLPSLVFTGRSAHADSHVAEYLEPHIARGEITILGESTPERLEATREEAPGFFSRFQIVQIPPLAEPETLMVLVHAVRELEAREAVHVAPEVLETALALTRRFQPHQHNPGKAIALLQRLVGDYQQVELDAFGRRKITRERLIDFFGRQTGLPRFVLWEQQAKPWREVIEHFQRRIIGQPAASETAAEIVATLQQGLNDPGKPLATMLFVGPTGVGKTETAKALAEFLFGHKDRMIRLDMSEFRDPWSVSRLFGDRLQPEGELTRRVGQQPFSVVLLDEVEKAHPAVFDAFLQVLGEGRLTNAAGRTTDFCNTIVILTSNLGVRQAQQSLGFVETSGEREDVHYRKAAEQFFRPEFFNRIDRIVAFRSLGRESMGPLVRVILLELLGRRGLRRSGVLVQVEQDLVELLIDQGFDPRYGARSMRRALEQRLMVPLARHLVTQAVERTTLVQLYRFGREIGMDLRGLHEAPFEPMPPPQVRDWADLETRFRALMADLDALDHDPTVVRLQEERTALLAAFNAGQLDEPSWGSLQGANLLLDELGELRRDLDDFQDQHMERYRFFEEVEIVKNPDLITNYGAKHLTPRAVGIDRPMAVDRDAIFRSAANELRALEQRSARLWFQSQAIRQPEERVLLRILPATEEPGALRWALILAMGFWKTGSWWDGPILARRAGVWAQVEAPEKLPQQPRAGLEGFALWLRGFGLRRLLTKELGFHLQNVHSGPDLVCNLARLEDVTGAPDEDPAARLTQLDQDLAAWRDARREGRALPDPMPPLLVRRRLDRASTLDPETGEVFTIHADDGGYSITGLYEILVRRLLEAQRRARASA